MNSNGQILGEVSSILDDIRARKDRIKQLKSGLAAIDGKTQEGSIFQFGNSLRVELSYYDRSYMHTIRKHYKTAMVFIKRGINEEIEMHQAAIKNQELRLSKIDLVDLSK